MIKPSVDLLILRQAFELCKLHTEALQDALYDIELREFKATDLTSLNKVDRRLLDQFAYRYTRLQDDMGTKLFTAILRTLRENIDSLPMLDRLNRLEQLGWLPDADRWDDLRRIRNEFAHDYPDSAKERYDRMILAISSAHELIAIFKLVDQKMHSQFTNFSRT